jgi:hypothetical protein
MLVDWEYILYFINILELNFLPYINNANRCLSKKHQRKEFFFNSWEDLEVGRSETFSTTTYIGRF